MIAEFKPDEIKVLVFDVDDTVTRGTQDIKRKALNELFHDKLNLLNEARVLYEETGKGDRYNIIAHVIGEPQEGCTENETVVAFADKFEHLVQRTIRSKGIQQDDLEALILLSIHYKQKVYLVSATPQKSVEGNISFFRERYPELQNKIKKIVGTPFLNGKGSVLVDISKHEEVYTREILMVGDGIGDHRGAWEAGTQFVGIVPQGQKDIWKEEKFLKLESIAELKNLLLK